MKQLVLFSGGLDSTVLLTQRIREEGANNVLALSVWYGSLHNRDEGKAAERICEYFGVERKLISLSPTIFMGGGSALLGEVRMPTDEYHDPLKETPSQTIVPFRNGVLISVAVAYANANGYGAVSIAAHGNDAIGYAYPDCMPEFLTPMSIAVEAGTLGQVSLSYPFFSLSKAEVVARGYEVRAPLSMTWSCYRGDEVQCGNCPTCHERQKAFHDAGYMDPTRYQEGFRPQYEASAALMVFPPGEREWPLQQ